MRRCSGPSCTRNASSPKSNSRTALTPGTGRTSESMQAAAAERSARPKGDVRVEHATDMKARVPTQRARARRSLTRSRPVRSVRSSPGCAATRESGSRSVRLGIFFDRRRTTVLCVRGAAVENLHFVSLARSDHPRRTRRTAVRSWPLAGTRPLAADALARQPTSRRRCGIASSSNGDPIVWAQLIKMRLKPGREADLEKVWAGLRATEQPSSGLVRST